MSEWRIVDEFPPAPSAAESAFMPVKPINANATGSTLPVDVSATGPTRPAVILVAPGLGTGHAETFKSDRHRVDCRDREPVPWEIDLLRCLGLQGANERYAAGNIPAAHLLYALDRAAGAVTDVPAAHVVLADPVALTPGRDEANLLPSEALALTEAEIEALFTSANDWLEEDGHALLRSTSGRNYLVGLDGSQLETPPTHALARRDVGRHFPGSTDAAVWRRLMTEIQMHWHAHAVNEQREAAGLPSVNGIWFWGGAVPVSEGPAAQSLAVLADDDLALALSQLQGASVLPASLESVAGNKSASTADACAVSTLLESTEHDTLVIVDLAAYQAWLAGDAKLFEQNQARVANDRIEPLVKAVADGKIRSFSLLSGDGHETRWLPAEPKGLLQRIYRFGVRLVKPYMNTG